MLKIKFLENCAGATGERERIMNNTIAIFEPGLRYIRTSGLWQYDYGQVLRIQGINLPSVVEIHFSLTDKSGSSVTRIGTSKDGVTEVVIPDSMLENNGIGQNYNIYAFVYLTDEKSGNTEYQVKIPVKTRPKPEVPVAPEKPDLFRNVVKTVNDATDRAKVAEKSAEAWVHGNENYPERENDNARYYADQAHKEAASILGRVEEGKKSIDSYVNKKREELKGNTGNVFFAAFRVVDGRLKMYSDASVDKVCFERSGSRLKYRLKI